MTELDMLMDLHRRQARQGPGSDYHSLLALQLSGLTPSADLRVADIGCGTGASTLALAGALPASITAVDFLPGFIDELRLRADAAGLDQRIRPGIADMNALPFADGKFDLLWSEGAIYSMGFSRGLARWRRFLRPGGLLAVSEITWLTAQRPAEIEAFWTANYPEIDTAAGKFRVLEQQGYSALGYFTLPPSCWLENYYHPLAADFEHFLDRHDHSAAAHDLVAEHRQEQALYEKYSEHYSYGFYIARRSD
ncbi:methyltransferase domain-containing protein [Seongchinamella sediminis]|uniref:Methyltransferase domain-containing protein n=1 Tax=Seongchinamella sediminis TaxID=2283635 RepID=A0A3L7DZT5_9GAMM|nr:class I SAM-dependent methyltransferase [Seongchinamella sediminis]RLQ23038.1 methyltransferase domain-containing protein [Seongchinamella sediminis]